MRILLVISLMVFLGFGVGLFVAPGLLEGIGIMMSGPEARIDIRATYGGMELGFAAFLILCLRREEWLPIGLCASGCVIGGFGVARLVAIGMEGAGTSLMWALVGIELGAALVIFALLRGAFSRETSAEV